jgi:D-alanyl-D-alanine carboxypeptidase-like protein
MRSEQAARRTVFLWLVAVILSALVTAWLLTAPEPVAPTRPSPDLLDREVTSPPAYLAWMPGGFPPSFRRRVSGLAGIRKAVVVAGDTRWLTATSTRDARSVDEPEPPFAIPIDAFAVDPDEYARFLPRELRAKVVRALHEGRAVLSTMSAGLRRLGTGGVLAFGDTRIEVGAVAPDAAIGWSEVLVSRTVGDRLGIEHDRYLLARAEGRPDEARFAALLADILPPDTPLRVAEPGTETFVRVASGVDPPVVMKALFGEFAAHPEEGNEAFLVMDPTWEEEHLDTRDVPLIGTVTCNRALFDPLVGALEQLEREGLGHLVHSYAGCYAARTVARTPTAPPSQHAYGAAIDINAEDNPFGAEPMMDPRVVRVFERWGFVWGGDFLIPDGQHFEYLGEPPT